MKSADEYLSFRLTQISLTPLLTSDLAFPFFAVLSDLRYLCNLRMNILP